MAVSVFPTPSTASYSVPNWTLLQNATPSGVASVTFSGLSGYSKYRIAFAGQFGIASSATVMLQLNGDTTTTYFGYARTMIGSGSATAQFNGGGLAATSLQITMGAGSNSYTSFTVDIDHALLSSGKYITYSSATQGTTPIEMEGFGRYVTTSTLTSIKLLASAGSFSWSTGNMELLGAN